MPTDTLPPLRDDLDLIEGPAAVDGSPTWTVHDPVRNRFHRLGQRAFDILSVWHLARPEAMAQAMEQRTGRAATPEELDWMATFLRAQSLLRQDSEEAPRLMERVANAGRRGILSRVLHNYLFIRIPLIRPDRLLTRTEPLLRPFFSRAFWIGLLAAGVIGLLLALRQWDDFTHTFLHFFSAEGIIAFGAALVFAKLVHEAAHACTAKHFGCRVPTMGIAFLVMWPVLYTDTGDTWRLPDRRRRMLVGAAGMLAELALAAIATLLWSFLPDGPARSAAFLVATVTWISTLLINLNPFMRFDGYYLLSDALGVENLQERGFAFGRWQLRRGLLGWDAPPPESASRGLRRVLIAWAYATWVWRFLLFLGIALLVYHLFFKVLGLVLFAVEIWWFILRPIIAELRVMWGLRASLGINRTLVRTGAVLGVGLILLAVPWRSDVAVPAILQAERTAVLYAPTPARIVHVALEPGRTVAEGEVLITLTSPRLTFEIAQADRRIAISRTLVLRQAAGAEDAENIRVLRRRLISEQAKLEALTAERDRLSIRAPFSGRITDIAPGLAVGRWISETLGLARLVDPARTHGIGLVSETDRARLSAGAKGRFVPEDPTRAAIPVRLTEIAPVDTDIIDRPALASIHGGPVAARQTADGRIVPTGGVYRAQLSTEAVVDRQLRGTARLEGEARSVLGRLADRVLAVLIRESGV